jgi:P pilus assembly protein, pilin FimA
MLKKTVLASAVLLSMSTNYVLAGTANLKLHGSVVESTCDIVAEDKSKVVELGRYPSTMFKQYSVSPSKNFTITLENCEPGNYGVRFDAPTFEGHPDWIQITKALNPRGVIFQDLAIQILNNEDEPIPMAEQNTQANFTIEEMGKDAVIRLKARFIALKDRVRPFDVTSIVNFAIEYK